MEEEGTQERRRLYQRARFGRYELRRSGDITRSYATLTLRNESITLSSHECFRLLFGPYAVADRRAAGRLRRDARRQDRRTFRDDARRRVAPFAHARGRRGV